MRIGQSRIAVVTGGTTGIGLATARRLLKGGHRVAIFSQRSESVAAAQQSLETEHPPERVLARTVDLVDASAITSFFREVERVWGTPGILVCNAGISPKGRSGAVEFSEISLREWNEVLAVNLTGTMLCCQAVGPGMIRNGFGRIILLGSVAARTRPKIAGASYVASKAALAGLSKALIGPYSPSGITINLVAPGRILTGMTGAKDDASNRAALSRIPIGRLGEPDDVAAVIEFLTSEDAGFVNGAVIDVNGGEVVPN
ncbi:SDR family oxidoreductase [Mesorhizobium sp. DCY119]|uniref:SDR family oxidoreductase n=1 Tax=Mesorhizobium sp. DCY119 TaxID=2108445 RepID=UPI000E76B491|nr:SDR family oxidoreductase [Mesorhizobium sp. DCY119]RJG41011.1 SDR family oxidoreductase [Mesorhizobium sp. DCY119]